MTDTKTNESTQGESPAIDPLIETYRTWVETLAGYMKQGADLLEGLYAEQDETIDQLRKLCSKTHSLRHADFDTIFTKVLAERSRARESVSAVVDAYRASREAVIEELREMLASGRGQAAQAWPVIKQRLLGEQDDGVGEIVAALRQIHVEQERISAALSGLLMRGERLKIDDLKTVAQRLARRDSQQTAELGAILALCESAGRNAAVKWHRLAG